MANDRESATSRALTGRLSQPARSAETDIDPVEADSLRGLRDLIDELAGLEENVRLLRLTKPSPDAATSGGELRRLKSRQRVVLRELRHRARRRAPLRPSRSDSSALSDDTSRALVGGVAGTATTRSKRLKAPDVELGSAARAGQASRGGHAISRPRATGRCWLPVSGAAPHLAREFVRIWACPDHLVDPQEACLLVSELVTNAVVHGQGPIRLTVRCAGTRAVIAVTDGGPGLPIIPATRPPTDALAGRGLWLLVNLAEDWGIRAHAETKTIWFAMANQSPQRTS
jgi:anti-sigma regulatory factor (Ser/Thr protein kinase)